MLLNRMLAHAMWMLTGLSAVVLATLSGRSWQARSGLALAFVVSTAWCVTVGLPTPAAIGLATACAAVLLLLRPETAWVAPVLGGGLAGAWVALQAESGAPFWIAVPAGAVWVALPAYLSARPAFAPRHVRDEALLIVAVLAVGVAMLPAMTDGWRAAVGLSVHSTETSAGATVPAWALGIGVSSILLGALSSMWSRR